MKRLLALLVLSLLMALPAVADVTLGPGGTVTRLIQDGVTENVGDVFAEMEFTRSIGTTNDLGLAAFYHGDEFAGIGVRYYITSAGGWVHPGIGGTVMALGTDMVSENTTLLGLEALLGVDIPFDGREVTIKAFGGWYPSVDGAEVTMYRYGLIVPLELLRSR